MTNLTSPKIDDLAVNGLLGVNNSLAYKVHEIEKHFHNNEKWFGAAASASGETHVADRFDGAVSAFQVIAGNSTFGSWVQILGSSDTPVAAGMEKYDAHRFIITDTNNTSTYLVQIASGESAGLAQKIIDEGLYGVCLYFRNK